MPMSIAISIVSLTISILCCAIFLFIDKNSNSDYSTRGQDLAFMTGSIFMIVFLVSLFFSVPEIFSYIKK